MPSLETVPAEPESGMARVIFSTDVPARIREGALAVRSHYRGPPPRLLCATSPCAVTLAYGDYEVHYQSLSDPDRWDDEVIRIAKPTEVVNHTLGSAHSTGSVVVGAGLLLAGIVTTSVAVGMAEKPGESQSQDRSTAGGVACAGLLGIVLGSVILAASGRAIQPGATTQWSPASGVRF